MAVKKAKSKSAAPSKARRDVEATKERLVQVALRVIAEEGFPKLGVNRVAREAGVDKVLIYRYFGDLEGLLSAAAESADFWPSYEELVEDANDLDALPTGKAVATVFKRFARSLHQRPLALEILAWETVARTEHTAVFESVREQLGVRLGQLLASRLSTQDVDGNAVVCLIAAAINYLSVRRRSIRVFNYVEINSEAGWQQLEGAIDVICERVFGD